MQQLFSLKNKVIIITGATGVLGEAFVNASRRNGRNCCVDWEK